MSDSVSTASRLDIIACGLAIFFLLVMVLAVRAVPPQDPLPARAVVQVMLSGEPVTDGQMISTVRTTISVNGAEVLDAERTPYIGSHRAFRSYLAQTVAEGRTSITIGIAPEPWLDPETALASEDMFPEVSLLVVTASPSSGGPQSPRYNVTGVPSALAQGREVRITIDATGSQPPTGEPSDIIKICKDAE